MNLFIVESPGKRPTIQKYLDEVYGPRTYVVAATCGHFCGLPAMDGQAFSDVVNPTTWDENWVIHKNDVYASLKRLIDNADRIYIATDADREGEAIAWHVMRAFRLDERRTRRVRYNEVTKTALKAAIDNPLPLDLNLVAAQRARQVLDYEFGMELSRPLWRFSCRSAGRVQSAAVRILVDRENAIQAFRAQSFVTIAAHFVGPVVATLHTSAPAPLVGELSKHGAEEAEEDADDTAAKSEGDAEATSRFRLLRIADPAVAKHLEAVIRSSSHVLSDVQKRQTTRKPPAPFITSTLLQTASQVLRLPAKKVTAIAQSLFEKGLVTYIRTDSPALAEEAIAEIRAVLADKHPKLLPKEPQRYAAKGSAQGAHEAIRPTHMNEAPANLADLSKEERAVYDLIWEQTLRCQAKSAVLENTTMTIAVDGHAHLALIARGTVILEQGFLALQKTPAAPSILPSMSRGQRLQLGRLAVDGGTTKPPPRFTEGNLTKHLEKHGIGRPATYAAVMASIVERDYVEVTNEKTRELAPTPLGKTSDGLLRASFDALTRSDFTAQIERSFDKIEDGKLTRQLFLTTFDKGLRAMLASSAQRLDAFAKEHPELDRDAVVQDHRPCRKCGGIRDLRLGRLGRMASCRSCAHVDLVEPKDRSKSACHLDAQHGLMAKLTAKGSSTPFYKCLTCDYTSSTEAPPPPCPLCKALTARRKNAAGEYFWGCTQFSKTGCRGVAPTPTEVSRKPRMRKTQRSKRPVRRRNKAAEAKQ